MASPRAQNAQQVQIAIRKIHGPHLQEQILKCVFSAVCFNTSETMTMDAGAEKKITEDILYKAMKAMKRHYISLSKHKLEVMKYDQQEPGQKTNKG